MHCPIDVSAQVAPANNTHIPVCCKKKPPPRKRPLFNLLAKQGTLLGIPPNQTTQGGLGGPEQPLGPHIPLQPSFPPPPPRPAGPSQSSAYVWAEVHAVVLVQVQLIIELVAVVDLQAQTQIQACRHCSAIALHTRAFLTTRSQVAVDLCMLLLA